MYFGHKHIINVENRTLKAMDQPDHVTKFLPYQNFFLQTK